MRPSAIVIDDDYDDRTQDNAIKYQVYVYFGMTRRRSRQCCITRLFIRCIRAVDSDVLFLGTRAVDLWDWMTVWGIMQEVFSACAVSRVLVISPQTARLAPGRRRVVADNIESGIEIWPVPPIKEKKVVDPEEALLSKICPKKETAAKRKAVMPVRIIMPRADPAVVGAVHAPLPSADGLPHGVEVAGDDGSSFDDRRSESSERLPSSEQGHGDDGPDSEDGSHEDNGDIGGVAIGGVGAAGGAGDADVGGASAVDAGGIAGGAEVPAPAAPRAMPFENSVPFGRFTLSRVKRAGVGFVGWGANCNKHKCHNGAACRTTLTGVDDDLSIIALKRWLLLGFTVPFGVEASGARDACHRCRHFDMKPRTLLGPLRPGEDLEAELEILES